MVDGQSSTVWLYRSSGQRAIGWFMVASTTIVVAGIVFGLVGGRVGASFAVCFAVLLPLLVLQSTPMWRLARCGPGRIRLEADELIVVDESLFHGPVVLRRGDIADVVEAPKGIFERIDAVRTARASLLSLAADKADLLISFRVPLVFGNVRRNKNQMSHDAPRNGKPTHGFWLRTATLDDRQKLLGWAAGVANER